MERKKIYYSIPFAISTLGAIIGSLGPTLYPRTKDMCVTCIQPGESALITVFFISAPVAVYSLWKVLK